MTKYHVSGWSIPTSRRRVAKLVVLLSVICARAAAQSDTALGQLPTLSKIRAYYEEIEKASPVFPDIVRMTFVVSEDKNLFSENHRTSTITMQIVTPYLLGTKGRTERVELALHFEEALSRQEILTWYLNRIFLGQHCTGVTGAAQAYFGKGLPDLATEEVAYLAALPAAPLRFHPVEARNRALKRRNFVLKLMAEEDIITTQRAKTASKRPLVALSPLGICAQPKNP